MSLANIKQGKITLTFVAEDGSKWASEFSGELWGIDAIKEIIAHYPLNYSELMQLGNHVQTMPRSNSGLLRSVGNVALKVSKATYNGVERATRPNEEYVRHKHGWKDENKK